MTSDKPFDISCPLPLKEHPRISMAHGAGGRAMQSLIEELFYAAFDNPLLRNSHDGVVLPSLPGHCVMTTDSYVVHPLFFPGGNIGSLAVNGTVNDLAMCGARPRYLTAAFILEEGLDIETLWQVVRSMGEAAKAAGVDIVTGDTKVVERGRGDGVYINTAGIGGLETQVTISPRCIAPGDAILLSGDIARHGMAVMGEREGLAFSTPIESDCAPLWPVVEAMLGSGIDIHCLRDATRGGLGAVLNELAQASGLQVDVNEADIAISKPVRGACEVLGLDPLHVACEGRFVAVVAQRDQDKALATLKRYNDDAAVIGQVTQGEARLVTLKTPIGGRRILDMPAGELLPRIC